LKKFSFPYKKEPSTLFGHIYRPVVEIYLKTKENQWFKVSTYADSGADITIFPKSVSEILGLKLQDGQESTVTGVGGEEIKIFIHKITIRIEEEKLHVRAGFAEREDIPYLLGRTDILTHFNILFKKDKVVFVKK
jgi:predicted aspartyl protease